MMNKILGIGTDIVEIERIRDSLKEFKEKFLERICTEKERAYCLQHKDPAPQLAARFAAKEAIAKALGTGIGKTLSWQDIEIQSTKEGKPEAALSPQAAKAFDHPQILLSMSHCKEYATAVAVLIKN